MNYIRGAVNAISAPYQYYKELPPINPSTLTGAIDVIVIQRPAEDGTTELVCSPFHVRFGKWQVLMPGEKKVSISVNGTPIPYSMKVGEAGEAFFVFETDDDVPEDLITSPILEPVRPDQNPPPPGAPQLPSKDPEFLDLNAEDRHDGKLSNANNTPRPLHHTPNFANNKHAEDALPSPTTPRPDTRTTLMEEQDRRVDEALKAVKHELGPPKVEYHHDVTLDGQGYHAHAREESERTVRSSKGRNADNEDEHAQAAQTHRLERREGRPSTHIIRATSEPPPDFEIHPHIPSEPQQPPALQEYSWEWGAFPQPSPMGSSFNIPARDLATWSKGKTKSKIALYPTESHRPDGSESDSDDLPAHLHDHGRSRSVPPGLEGSPKQLKKVREPFSKTFLSPSEDDDDLVPLTGVQDLTIAAISAGGRLLPSKTDPSRFVLVLDGKKMTFELSIVSPVAVDDGEESATRGRRKRDGGVGGVLVFDGRSSAEEERLFERGKLDFQQFLDNAEDAHNPNLVIRWAPNQYVTRNDGSPLMSALIHWRENTLQFQSEAPRPLSPTSEGEEEEEEEEAIFDDRDSDAIKPDSDSNSNQSPALFPNSTQSIQYNTPTAFKVTTPGGKSRTSWVQLQWWSRNRLKEPVGPNGLPAPVTAPSTPPRSTGIVVADPRRTQTLPAVPVSVEPVQEALPRTRFAKTLRLTSDQLKSLELKPGANSITFSLSATGAIACTARIFMWNHTDLVVISDIDGTITKSDGLGHVFAMIGRDWTHVGVAKLYTDICRNGYKIMYLTSRAIGQADSTRDYLKGIKQNNYQLPEGPVIMSPDRLMASLHREVIMRKPEVFKMACLRDIKNLFGEHAKNPFYGGFGNRITDALSYRSVNIPSSRIFTIDSTGEVKLELLELAGYKSSYIHMTDLVDQMFPPIHRKWAPEYTDFNYWKPPIETFPLPAELMPPSPALSARSDTSNQSALTRLKNFRLGSGRGGGNSSNSNSNSIRHSASLTLPPPVLDGRPGARPYHSTNGNTNTNANGSAHGDADDSSSRSMSSFERLSSAVRRSLSPSSISVSSASFYGGDNISGNEDEGDGEEEEEGDGEAGWEHDERGHRIGRKAGGSVMRRNRRRRVRATSMPGSLDDRDFGFDEEDEHGFGYHDHEGESGYDVEEEEEGYRGRRGGGGGGGGGGTYGYAYGRGEEEDGDVDELDINGVGGAGGGGGGGGEHGDGDGLNGVGGRRGVEDDMGIIGEMDMDMDMDEEMEEMEPTFDEDLMAAVEMKSVPFL